MAIVPTGDELWLDPEQAQHVQDPDKCPEQLGGTPGPIDQIAPHHCPAGALLLNDCSETPASCPPVRRTRHRVEGGITALEAVLGSCRRRCSRTGLPRCAQRSRRGEALRSLSGLDHYSCVGHYHGRICIRKEKDRLATVLAEQEGVLTHILSISWGVLLKRRS